MKKKNILMPLLFLILVLPFSSAIGCDAQGWKGYSKLYDNKTVTITCPTCTYINFSAINPQGEEFLSNVQMTSSGSTFTYLFTGSDLDNVGTYFVDGYSNLDDPLAFCFDVTITGKENSVATYIMLLVLLSGAFLGLVGLNLKFDDKRREKLYSSIVTNSLGGTHGDNKNLGLAIMYSLGYGILKNIIALYYVLGVAFLFILTEFISAFGISSITLLLTTILNVFIYGFMLVFIIMVFVFYGIFRQVLKDVDLGGRGLYDGK